MVNIKEWCVQAGIAAPFVLLLLPGTPTAWATRKAAKKEPGDGRGGKEPNLHIMFANEMDTFLPAAKHAGQWITE